MNRLVFLAVTCFLVLTCQALAQESQLDRRLGLDHPGEEHPRLSINGTEVLQTENWIDTFLVELRVMKNLENGTAVGLKLGSDFSDEIETSLGIKKMIQTNFYAYGDFGYAFDAKEGVIGELGLGTYFLEHQRLGLHFGFKYYFGPDLASVPIGFSINF